MVSLIKNYTIQQIQDKLDFFEVEEKEIPPFLDVFLQNAEEISKSAPFKGKAIDFLSSKALSSFYQNEGIKGRNEGIKEKIEAIIAKADLIHCENNDIISSAFNSQNRFLLERIYSIPFEKSSEGFAPLHLVAYLGNLEEVRKQLSINTNITTNTNYTPFHFACLAGHLHIVEFLLQNKDLFGIKPNAITKWKDTPLHLACWNGHLHIVKFLLQNKDLFGIDPNAIDDQGQTPIYYAYKNGHLHIVEFLLQNKDLFGIDPNAKTVLKETPLHLACWFRHLHIVEFLLQNKEEFGIDPNAKNIHGRTPLCVAYLNADQEIVQCYLDASQQTPIDVLFGENFVLSYNDSYKECNLLILEFFSKKLKSRSLYDEDVYNLEEMIQFNKRNSPESTSTLRMVKLLRQNIL